MIRLLKLCLAQSLEGKQCSIVEHLAEAAQVLNSYPIAQSKTVEDASGDRPITLLHLQLNWEGPQGQFDLSSSLTKRLRYLDEIKKDFWKKWISQVFQGKVLAQKWKEGTVMPKLVMECLSRTILSRYRVSERTGLGGHSWQGRSHQVPRCGVQEPL